ncbi:hypothetical protein J7J00_11455 [Bacillus sp. ISL-4]|uniref:hypothetical protein n=1 Tax=Bacillus sp. ISL-4 TaxID=2819125 RepID=UPI001BE519BF|nr:hypothetical protein [Bacillus sp. ISL-4]MBT2666122.1 hypothetical protein [Bacillus sp. ISL-4]MBT2670159.1 hypothetical protein [Streptomyces sp. ISL-14]
MTHVQKAVLHVETTRTGELPAKALNVALAGGGPLPVRKGALAGNRDLHATHKGALAGRGPLPVRKGALAGGGPLAVCKGAPAETGVPYAADKGAPTETVVPPTTAVGFAAITFAINGASSFMVPF